MGILLPGTCRVCGCTDDQACAGGCHWVDVDHTLCSRCDMTFTPAEREMLEAANRETLDFDAAGGAFEIRLGLADAMAVVGHLQLALRCVDPSDDLSIRVYDFARCVEAQIASVGPGVAAACRAGWKDVPLFTMENSQES